MSPSAFITVRTVKSGKRYVVRYRIGGSQSELIHAGSFKTQKDARKRRDFVISELASGRDPRTALRELTVAPTIRTLAQWGRAWLDSRVDVDESTRAAYEYHLNAILTDRFKEMQPGEVTPADVQTWIGELKLAPSTIRAYLTTFRQILDYADVEPNPARSKKVRVPRRVKEEHTPPPSTHVLTILERLAKKHRLLFVTLEQTAMRVGEAETLSWGDVDAAGSRFRIRSRETKTQRAKWVPVPGWLMTLIENTCPVEDRTPTRRVFQGTGDVALRRAMASACRTAGIPHYHPHDLRHRRASIWHGQGVTARELAERGGWSTATVPLDVYSHVMPLDEVPGAKLAALIVRSP